MTFRQDVVYAIRLLRRSPVFTVTAVLSVAVGIGANAAIFSLADALLLRARPGIGSPEMLVDVARTQGGEGFDNMSYLNFVDFRDRNTVFDGLAGFRFGSEPVGLGTGDGAERVFGTAVSGNYFDVLRVPMALGRGFLPSEDAPGAGEHVAVLSHRLWQRRFDGARNILDRAIQINGRPFTVVGVTAEGFVGNTITETDLWMPMAIYPAATGRGAELLNNRRAVWMIAVGRLKPGITIRQAQSQMTAIAADLAREYPDSNRNRGVALSPSHRLPGMFRTYVSAFVGLLFALVGLVLAIACTNVAGMLLARAVARGREFAVRIAIGAQKGRIVRQLVTESLLISLAGAAGGVALAIWAIAGLRALVPALPVMLAVDFRLDWRVLIFSIVLAVGTGVLFGLAPALQAARTDLAATMKSDASIVGPRRLRLRQAFVVAQIAMSVLLVICGLLFARSLINAATIDPGFEVSDVEVAAIDFRLAGYDRTTGPVVQTEILTRAEQLAGVRTAAFAAQVPLTGGGLGLGPLRLPGEPADAPSRFAVDWNVVTPKYFETMRSSLASGRAFTEMDRDSSTPVAIVNETFARRAWPGEDPTGKTLEHYGETKRALQIVGIAKDAKYRSLGESPRAFIYVPLTQNYFSDLTLLVRTDGRRLASDIRALLRQVNPNLPIVHSATLAETAAIGLLPNRLAAALAGAFGVVGLLLAGIGIYGVTAYDVTQRTREIGVRVALGAARRDVLALVLLQSMRMSVTGALIGVLLAVGATRLLADLLYGIAPLDPVSFATSVLLFCVLAFAASWWPARRAASLHPIEALRHE